MSRSTDDPTSTDEATLQDERPKSQMSEDDKNDRLFAEGEEQLGLSLACSRPHAVMWCDNNFDEDSFEIWIDDRYVKIEDVPPFPEAWIRANVQLRVRKFSELPVAIYF